MRYSNKRYSLLGYNKDHDIYDVLTSSDNYSEILKQGEIFAPLIYQGRLRSSINFESYDWLEIFGNHIKRRIEVISPTGKVESL